MVRTANDLQVCLEGRLDGFFFVGFCFFDDPFAPVEVVLAGTAGMPSEAGEKTPARGVDERLVIC